MGIKFEWLKHPQQEGSTSKGIARFKIGEKYHHVNIASIASAMQLHKLLQHAHEAGVIKGEESSATEERQRVSDLLGG